MKWEDLKVYRPLKKEELKKTFKEFTRLVGEGLKEEGFRKKDRKLVRLTNDLVEVIDFDYRGTWSGQNEYFKTMIGLVPLSWPNLDKAYYTVAAKEINEVVSGIKNHYRITQEFDLLADFYVRVIKEKVLDYFDKYNSTLKGEIKNRSDIYASKLIEARLIELKRQSSFYIDDHVRQGITEWEKLYTLTVSKKWEELINWLTIIEQTEIKKQKIKPAANIGYPTIGLPDAQG